MQASEQIYKLINDSKFFTGREDQPEGESNEYCASLPVCGDPELLENEYENIINSLRESYSIEDLLQGFLEAIGSPEIHKLNRYYQTHLYSLFCKIIEAASPAQLTSLSQNFSDLFQKMSIITQKNPAWFKLCQTLAQRSSSNFNFADVLFKADISTILFKQLNEIHEKTYKGETDFVILEPLRTFKVLLQESRDSQVRDQVIKSFFEHNLLLLLYDIFVFIDIDDDLMLTEINDILGMIYPNIPQKQRRVIFDPQRTSQIFNLNCAFRFTGESDLPVQVLKNFASHIPVYFEFSRQDFFYFVLSLYVAHAEGEIEDLLNNPNFRFKIKEENTYYSATFLLKRAEQSKLLLANHLSKVLIQLPEPPHRYDPVSSFHFYRIPGALCRLAQNSEEVKESLCLPQSGLVANLIQRLQQSAILQDIRWKTFNLITELIQESSSRRQAFIDAGILKVLPGILSQYQQTYPAQLSVILSPILKILELFIKADPNIKEELKATGLRETLEHSEPLAKLIEQNEV